MTDGKSGMFRTRRAAVAAAAIWLAVAVAWALIIFALIEIL